MSHLLLGLAAAGVVGAVGIVARPRAARQLRAPAARRPVGGWLDGRTLVVLHRLGLPPWHAEVRRRARRAISLGLLLAPLGIPLALLPAAISWLHTQRRSHARSQERQRALAQCLPDAVDLLGLCTSAGLTLPLAHPLLADAVAPPLGPALAAADRVAEHGRSRADALTDALHPLGDGATALAHVLADHLRYGTALAPALDRLGVEVRLHRRRRAEEQARRVPVRLLGPLVACVLPAFGLLTVVPLLAASLHALPA